ncbi:response regulator [Maridesulfovibrio hydrothermalis]|uniref:histidine kinase n=1 Tax=Maridesulfovibrio hydrothermalis AM13 = DSM 14728 TaxID=1121451 RepID=L0RDQ8_9BACT|nr:response regulator [Maridesulfovibrio hydrothermalis]CCO23706.1 Multi-sensor signal transduction histidine kinase [Maridesulfovibrio hydrothermalis AM13 = DSM 14728]
MSDKKLMLVDDEEGIRRFLGLTLIDLGYSVETAENGEAALKLLETFQPAIVLTDIKMPRMDGIDLLKAIKSDYPHVEVIMLTGHGDLDLAIESLKFEAADFITKPINDDVLEISLGRVMEKIDMKNQLKEHTENLERLVEEKTQRIIELERQNAACQVVEGLSEALSSAANEVETGSGLFNELPCLVSIHNRYLEIVATNKLLKERLGDVVGYNSFDIYSDRNSAGNACPVQLTFETGKGQRSKETFISKDGEEIPVTVYTAPLPNQNGDIELVLDISVDMTELKRLRDELLETQYKFQRLFDESPCYISVQNKDFSIAEVNRRFKEDFDDPLGASCYSAYKHRDNPCEECPVQRTFTDGESHQMETVVTTRKGDQKNVLVWSAPIRNAYGEVIQVMEMSTDITEIRRLQDHLTSLGFMLGSMSHGVKGMLTALDGGIYRLESGLRKNDETRVAEAAKVLKNTVGRVKKMVLDILYYAKSREIDVEKIEASTFLTDTAAIVAPKAAAANIKFNIDIPDDLGTVTIDTSAMSATLVNFLENAVDACEIPVDGKEFEIGFSARDNGDSLSIVVTDNGTGMDPETRDKIFTLFFSSKGKKGTGIGLFISNQTIEQHGGKITVESESGKGTTFTISLPRTAESSKKPSGDTPRCNNI